MSSETSELCKGFITAYLTFCRYQFSTFFRFDHSTNEIYLEKSQKFLRLYKIRLGLAYFLTFFAIFQTVKYHSDKQGTEDAAALLEVIYIIACCLTFCLVTTSHIRKGKELVNLHNAGSRLKNKIGALSYKAGTARRDKCHLTCKIVLWNTAANSVIAHLGRLMVCLSFPCVPDLSGSILIPECHTGIADVFSNIVKICVVLLNAFILYSLYFQLNLEVICFTYIPCVTMNRYINLLQRILMQVSGKVETKFIQGTISSFRQMQLLLTCFNDVHQSDGILIGLCNALISVTICLFSIIRFRSKLVLAQFQFFVSAGIQGLLMMMLVYGALGKVFANSEELMRKVKSNVALQRNPWFRRVFGSWPILRVRMGQANYFDWLTSFTLLGFCIDWTLNALLLG